MRRRLLLALPVAALAFGLPAVAPAQTLLERLAGTSFGANSFVELASISDNFEIESSRILLARSQHPQIRQFAQTMIEHHTMSSQELLSLPEATTRTPARLDDRHATMLTALRSTENEDMLNRLYVQQQVQGHEETLAIMQAYAANGDVPALRAFAQKYQPVVARHLEQARALQAPRRE